MGAFSLIVVINLLNRKEMDFEILSSCTCKKVSLLEPDLYVILKHSDGKHEKGKCYKIKQIFKTGHQIKMQVAVYRYVDASEELSQLFKNTGTKPVVREIVELSDE